MGIELEPGQVAMRCNLVTVLDGRMASYSAGNISSAESAELIAALQNGLGDERSALLPRSRLQAHPHRAGRRATPRHLDSPRRTTSPGSRWRSRRRSGPGAAFALDLMERSKAILAGHPVNERRVARGKPPATQIWLFWPGVRPAEMPAFADLYAGQEGGAHVAGRPAEGTCHADRHRCSCRSRASPTDPTTTTRAR